MSSPTMYLLIARYTSELISSHFSGGTRSNMGRNGFLELCVFFQRPSRNFFANFLRELCGLRSSALNRTRTQRSCGFGMPRPAFFGLRVRSRVFFCVRPV